MGPTFHQLHLLFDKHYEKQNKLVDAIAERVQLLGAVSVAMAHDVAETTLIPRRLFSRGRARRRRQSAARSVNSRCASKGTAEIRAAEF